MMSTADEHLFARIMAPVTVAGRAQFHPLSTCHSHTGTVEPIAAHLSIRSQVDHISSGHPHDQNCGRALRAVCAHDTLWNWAWRRVAWRAL